MAISMPELSLDYCKRCQGVIDRTNGTSWIVYLHRDSEGPFHPRCCAIEEEERRAAKDREERVQRERQEISAEMQAMKRRGVLHELRVATLAHLQARVADQDWHGVSNDACDLREIDAELRGLSGA